MPELRTSDDAIDAQLALVTAVAAGEVSPRDADGMMSPLDKAKSILRGRESDARCAQLERERAEAAAARAEAIEQARAAAAAEAAALVEIFEEPAPAAAPCSAAGTDATRSSDDPVRAGPLAFLDYPDPDGIGAGIREAMLKADPGLRQPYPPYDRERVRRIGCPVPV